VKEDDGEEDKKTESAFFYFLSIPGDFGLKGMTYYFFLSMDSIPVR
jgi:hypothetical protein